MTAPTWTLLELVAKAINDATVKSWSDIPDPMENVANIRRIQAQAAIGACHAEEMLAALRVVSGRCTPESQLTVDRVLAHFGDNASVPDLTLPLTINQVVYSVFERLKADSALMADITGIFERIPQSTAFPYATWGGIEFDGESIVFDLHVWSREGGRKQVASIMERIHTLRHDKHFGGAATSFVSCEITLQKDGWTYDGAMRFTSRATGQAV